MSVVLYEFYTTRLHAVYDHESRSESRSEWRCLDAGMMSEIMGARGLYSREGRVRMMNLSYAAVGMGQQCRRRDAILPRTATRALESRAPTRPPPPTHPLQSQPGLSLCPSRLFSCPNMLDHCSISHKGKHLPRLSCWDAELTVIVQAASSCGRAPSLLQHPLPQHPPPLPSIH